MGFRKTVVGACCWWLLALVAAGCASVGPGDEIGTTSSALFANDRAAFDYFLGKGLTNFQAAGIVGNLDQESGVDPTAVQGGGPGRGIAQWSVGGRWDTDTNDNATWYASTLGQNVWSLPLQLDFIWYELTTFSGYGLTQLRATSNVTDATVAFMTDFEMCGACNQTQRVAYAQAVLSAYGADVVDGGLVADGGGAGGDGAVGTPCTVTPTGESGECLDIAACAALGNHESVPGYCPGPANVQCCTAVTPGDAGASGQADAGLVDDAGRDADSGIAGDDAAPDADAGGPDGSVQNARLLGGCSLAAETGSGADAGLLVMALLLYAMPGIPSRRPCHRRQRRCTR